MDKLHYSLFLLIGLSLFLAAFSLATVQSAFETQDHSHLKLSESQHNQLDFDIGASDVRMKEYVDGQIMVLEQSLTALEDYDTIITTQIGNIRSDIISKFPQASDVQDQGQTAQSTPAFLTLKMDKSDFVLGNTVIFYGMAKPNNAVILTLKLPDRTLDSIAASKTQIIDGQWSANFTLRLDDPTGSWQVYARQGAGEQTKTLTFTVE